MELDGRDPRNLTNHPAVDWAYAAHGDRLFMVSDRDEEKREYHLYELPAKGGTPRRITDFRVNDSWIGLREDGSELVIASSKDGSPDLYLIDQEGNELRRLTEDDVKDNHPAFALDDTHVVWRSYRSGIDELWIMDLASGEARPRGCPPAA